MYLDEGRALAAPDLRALRRVLRSDMPVTSRLRIRVAGYREGGLVLHAPLAANINASRTAFAGSLNAAATLAGWATLWLLLREHGVSAHVVIQDSSVEYARPVTTDFEATCPRPEPGAIRRLIDAVRRRGRGRIELAVSVADTRGVAVSFSGRYVVVREAMPSPA